MRGERPAEPADLGLAEQYDARVVEGPADQHDAATGRWGDLPLRHRGRERPVPVLDPFGSARLRADRRIGHLTGHEERTAHRTRHRGGTGPTSGTCTFARSGVRASSQSFCRQPRSPHRAVSSGTRCLMRPGPPLFSHGGAGWATAAAHPAPVLCR